MPDTPLPLSGGSKLNNLTCGVEKEKNRAPSRQEQKKAGHNNRLRRARTRYSKKESMLLLICTTSKYIYMVSSNCFPLCRTTYFLRVG